MNRKSPAKLATLSDRLRYALSELDISQAELARRIQVQRQAVQYLCQSGTNKSKFAYDIADALAINIEWLLNGKGPMRQADSPALQDSLEQKIPLINWTQIPQWIQDQQLPSAHSEWTTTHTQASSTAFAVKLKDNAMHPRFDLGTIAVVDPALTPTNNCFVIADIKRLHECVFRQLVHTNKQQQLIAYNEEGYKALKLKPDDIILGCLLEARWTWPPLNA